MKTRRLGNQFLLIMESNVVISNQHNQFCVSGVSEHPVEAAHIVLPVLQRERENNTNTAEAGFSTDKVPPGSSGELMGSLKVTQQL